MNLWRRDCGCIRAWRHDPDCLWELPVIVERSPHDKPYDQREDE